MKPVRINPSMLAIAREDDLGKIAMPLLFAGAGAAIGLLAAPRVKRSSTAGALTGAALGIAAYLGANAVEKRR